MFAVILLGIGFIMLAGMFPVAIQQTRLTQEETTAATIVQTAKRYIEEVAYDNDFKSTELNNGTVGLLNTLPNNAWNNLGGNLINAQDRRYAWTALYRRNPGDNVIQVVILALQSRNAPQFVYPLDVNTNLTPVAIHITKLVNADNVNNNGVDRVIFDSNTDQVPYLKVAPGAFLILDSAMGPQIYRLGNRRDDIDKMTWELAPGFDMADNTENRTDVNAFIMGRGLDNTNTPAGFAMDIGCYVTFIRLK
jgi:hypothetical protein